MKRWKHWIALMLCAVVLVGCGGGDVSGVGRRISPSDRYSEGEIADAMDVVEAHFKKNFDGCKLHTIVYNEEATGRKAALEAEESGMDTIILLTDFWVDESGGDGSLNPDSMYRNYEWTLVKTFFGWKLESWGYA